MDKQERNYGIDLLRIVLMYMVCMLHVLAQGSVLRGCEEGTLRYGVFWFLEVCSYCAVNGFALISGYTAANKPQKYEKLVGMWSQAWFYSFLVTVILCWAGFGEPRGAADFIRVSMPVLNNSFWYFTAYVVLFFAMPMLNGFIFSLSEKQARKGFIILMVLFSAMTTVHDSFVTNDGYSPIWLIVLYCMGGFAKRIRLFEEKSTGYLVVCFAASTLLSWAGAVMGSLVLTSYVSPTMVLNGVLLVVLFSRIPVKGTYIRKIAPLVFGVYLFQLNEIVWGSILKDAAVFVLEKNLIAGICGIFGCAALLFFAGLLVEWLRSTLERLLRMQRVYCFIAEKAEAVLDRIAMSL